MGGERHRKCEKHHPRDWDPGLRENRLSTGVHLCFPTAGAILSFPPQWASSSPITNRNKLSFLRFLLPGVAVIAIKTGSNAHP